MSQPDHSPIAAAIAGLSQLQVIAETVTGYHKKLMDGGVGQEAADEMAKEFHTTLMGVMAKSMQAGASRAAAPRGR